MLKWSMLKWSMILFIGCQSNPYGQGEILYTNFCASCHMEDGSGLVGVIPPLADSDFLSGKQNLLPCIIRYGLKDSIIVNDKLYDSAMEGVPVLNDVEITNIINFIYYKWEGKNQAIRIETTKQILEKCQVAN